MAEPALRFVVKRLNWAERYGGKLFRRPGEVAVVSFATFEEADAERAKREDAYRTRVNPFECGGAVQYWTHLDEPRLRDWLMDHGIDPPSAKKDGTANWSAWWKKNQQALGAEKRAAVWEVLDKVRFFAVREEVVRPVGYAVVMINWEYNDETYDANIEEGEVMQVFRTRERAEEECEQMNDMTRDIWSGEVDDDVDEDDLEFGLFDMQYRLRRRRGLLPGEKLKKGEGVFNTAASALFYEVIEVSLEGLE